MDNNKIKVQISSYDFTGGLTGEKGKIVLKWKSKKPFKKTGQILRTITLCDRISIAVEKAMEEHYREINNG